MSALLPSTSFFSTSTSISVIYIFIKKNFENRKSKRSEKKREKKSEASHVSTNCSSLVLIGPVTRLRLRAQTQEWKVLLDISYNYDLKYSILDAMQKEIIGQLLSAPLLVSLVDFVKTKLNLTAELIIGGLLKRSRNLIITRVTHLSSSCGAIDLRNATDWLT